MNNNDEEDTKIFDMIWSVFAMFCCTAAVVYVAYSYYSPRIDAEPGTRPQIQQEDLPEIRKVE